MTKRMIDADALSGWVREHGDCIVKTQDRHIERCVNIGNIEELYIPYTIIIKKINKLAISAPAPESQDSIFDAEGWCWDMGKAPKEYIAHNGCRLAWINYDEIIPLGDIMAFDEKYFKKSMKQWRPLPKLPTGEKL
jgi:hypothetical protein